MIAADACQAHERKGRETGPIYKEGENPKGAWNPKRASAGHPVNNQVTVNGPSVWVKP